MNTETVPFNWGQPYTNLQKRVSLLKNYLEHAHANSDLRNLSNYSKNLPDLTTVHQLTVLLGRKPNVVLSGAFDAGKTTLANWLMDAGNILPAQYQPTTAVITYIRHIEDKPNWLSKNLVILKKRI